MLASLIKELERPAITTRSY